MHNHIIYLPYYQTSCESANIALQSSLEFGWNAGLFEGIDGMLLKDDSVWAQTGIRACELDRKTRAMMERPGVRGCFMSHYLLWCRCLELNTTIGIFEHDIEFVKQPPDSWPDFPDLLKLEGFNLHKHRPSGQWYEGARAYLLTTSGARKLIDWVEEFGALPADVVIGDRVLEITLDQTGYVRQQREKKTRREKHTDSFTWNLEQQA